MSVSSDSIIERRQLRRKLTMWRVAAALIAFVLIVYAFLQFNGGTMMGAVGTRASDHIARVTIEGTITADEELLERLERIGDSRSARALVVAVNSPGGTSVGGEMIFNAIREIAADRPVVAQVGGLAASAGYMIAAGADYIVASNSSIVGSIGVLVQYPNVTGLLDNLGVEVDAVKSSALKAEPSPFNETTEAERQVLGRVVNDIYSWFVQLVADRRPFDLAQARRLADGSVYSGRQAVENGLVDTLGSEAEVLVWLEEQGIDPSLEIVDWEAEDEESFLAFLDPIGMWIRTGDWTGVMRSASERLGLQGLGLDGALMLWQPYNE